MPKLNGKVPKYRLHRKSGQAIVTIEGKDHYLGPHGTDVSKAEYDRLIALWLAHGRRLPVEADEQSAVCVNDLILAFWRHAKNHYRKPDGTPTRELGIYRLPLRLLRHLYGRTSALEFGPKDLKAVRQAMIERGWVRSSINRQVARIRHVFRWAVEEEMVPAPVYQALSAVRGLQRGRTEAQEGDPVKPVPEPMVEAVEPFVSRQVWALIQLQLYSGARPGELLKLRSLDIDISADIWVVQPDDKTAWRCHDKTIYFGPKAQQVLSPFMAERSVDAYLFSPIEAEAERRAEQHAGRKTPASYGNAPGTNRRAKPKRQPKDHYTSASYRRAIERGCELAYPPPEHLARQRVPSNKGGSSTRWETDQAWQKRLGEAAWDELKRWQREHRWHPHQLRHNAATHIRKEFGIKVARIIVGQRSLNVTEIYAELDREKAEDAIRKIG